MYIFNRLVLLTTIVIVCLTSFSPLKFKLRGDNGHGHLAHCGLNPQGLAHGLANSRHSTYFKRND